MEKRSILDFVGMEYQNALISVANLNKEFGFLQGLDDIYEDIRTSFPVNPNNEVHFMVCMMFLQAHNEFYISMSQLFRSHLGKAFPSVLTMVFKDTLKLAAIVLSCIPNMTNSSTFWANF